MNDTCRWWNITGYLPYLEQLAKSRDEQKLSYRSTKNWSASKSTHFVGLCAEFAVYLETGLRLDADLKVQGDKGFDFEHNGVTYDAKGVTFWQSPDLKEFPGKVKHSDCYILVAVRYYQEVGVMGWATRQQLVEAPVVNYGHGQMLSLSFPTLKEMGQLGLPPELPRRSADKLKEMDAKLATKAEQMALAC